MIDVEPVQHDVEHHGIVVLLDERRHFGLQFEGASAAQEVVHLLRTVLKRQLNVIEARGLERRNAGFVEPDAGGDEVDVEPQPVRLGDDEFQVVANQRFAAGQAELHGAESACLTQHPKPILRGQFRPRPGEIRRVVAEHAVQRATIGQLQ